MASCSGASQPLFDALAPMGAYLPPWRTLSLRAGREVYASLMEHVGGAARRSSAFAYR